MKFRTTLGLLLLVGARLGVWRFCDVAEESSGPEPHPKLLDRLGAANVRRIEIDNAHREMTAFESRDGEWWIVEPYVDRADPAAVTNLQDVLAANPLVPVEENPSLDVLAKHQLEPPLARITLVCSEPDKGMRLRIGGREPTGVACYVKFEDDPVVYRTGANLANIMDRPRQEWRDPALLRGDAALVRRVEIQRPGAPRIVAERPAGVDWTLLEPVAFPADSGLVSKLVNGLMLLRVERFPVTEPTQEDLDRNNLGSQALAVAVDLGPRRIELRFGIDAGPGRMRYATDSVRKHAFIVSGPAIELLDVGAEALRDKRPLQFSREHVSWLRLQQDGRVRFELEYKPSERRFWFAQPFSQPCQDDRTSALRNWLVQLGNVEASGADPFLDPEDLPAREEPNSLDPLDALGLRDPPLVLEIKSSDAAGVPQSLRLEVGDAAGDVRPARRADRHPEVIYLLPREVVEPLLRIDPRVFLERRLVPEAIVDFQAVTVKAGARTLALRREGPESDALWFDPIDKRRKTGDFQEWLFKEVSGLEARSFQGRDAVPEDGLDPPFATVEIEFRGAKRNDPPLVLSIGALDATGAMCRVTTGKLPRSTVAEVAAGIRSELEKLLAARGD